jgi:3-oxoacyl-[acyl-carrier-protein] synthase II
MGRYMNRRAVITGLGPVSSIGVGRESFWKNVERGRGYFRNINYDDVEIDQYKSQVCSPIDELPLEEYFEKPRRLRKAGKATQYTVLGTYLALQDAGFTE